ncbi:hypothetical protein FJT64_019480 [Amphibalanus amphitrite]|uniref:Carbohydrate sulfotransferase n=1 Tax=Amphibalanus amphitrite TaxID=1232801 RepID=A0A6A4X4U4_AMPAM|nr:hypothetical protein FJT64_019480 [Amphibalanus amphitrite]
MFGILTGTLPNTSLEAIDHEKAHMYYVHRTLSQLSEPEIRRRLETYTSFMFVRHPLERMVSGRPPSPRTPGSCCGPPTSPRCKFPEGYRSATPGVTESLVSTVPSDGLRGVLRHYLQDLFLFGYRPQEVFQNTTARAVVQTMYEELLAEAQHDGYNFDWNLVALEE